MRIGGIFLLSLSPFLVLTQEKETKESQAPAGGSFFVRYRAGKNSLGRDVFYVFYGDIFCDDNRMKRVIEIEKLGQYRLDNSLHTWFHDKVCERIGAADGEKIGVPQTMVEEYRACVDEEFEMLKEVSGEENETKAILKKDAECDRLLSFILGVIRIMRLSPRQEVAEDAQHLYVLTHDKKRIQSEGIGRKPARIDSLLNDLKKPEPAAMITRLGLDEAVGLLKQANEDASRLQRERSNLRVRRKRPSMTQIRPKTDEVYHEVILQLQYAYKNNVPPIDREAIAELVRHLNEHTAHARMTYKKSLAQRRARRRQKSVPTDTENPV